MFEEKYKKAIENIAPTEDTKYEIIKKIQRKEIENPNKKTAYIWRAAFATVACAAIVLGIIFVPEKSIGIKTSGAVKPLSVASSYESVYKLLENTNQKYLRNGGYADGASYSDTEAAPETKSGSSANGAKKSVEVSDSDFSDTTEQVEGVSEADIVKTDGKYIYSISDAKLNIFKADGENSAQVSQTAISDFADNEPAEMFVKDDRLVILKNDMSDGAKKQSFSSLYQKSVFALIYDISDVSAPKKVAEIKQDGIYNSARMIGDFVYLISERYIDVYSMDKDKPETFVPSIICDNKTNTVPADRIYCTVEENCENRYTVVGAFDIKKGILTDTASLLGGTDNIYCSKENIIIANTEFVSAVDAKEDTYSQTDTEVSRFEIKDGKISYEASGIINGELENQFFIDEHNGYFRFVTTVYEVSERTQKFDNRSDSMTVITSDTYAKLTVLDSSLETVGSISDLARGEKVYSVRFMGDIAYFVTFRQTDPLFSADLSNPENPRILGELKITGFSKYMYPYGDGLLLGFGQEADERTGVTSSLKLSIFDIQNPENVTEKDKTAIEGYNYSPALWNHKAMLVSSGKNLIGFASGDSYGNKKYLIYKHTDNAFERAATLELNTKSGIEDVRALFIGDCLYIVTPVSLTVYDINNFLPLNQINIQ